MAHKFKTGQLVELEPSVLRSLERDEYSLTRFGIPKSGLF